MPTRTEVREVAEDGKVRVSVRILGEDYIIKSSPDVKPDYIRKIAQEVDERLRVASSANPKLPRNHMVVLACLNIMDELERLRVDYEGLMKLIEEGREL